MRGLAHILFSLGARISLPETLLAFVAPLAYVFMEREHSWLLLNAACQLLIFVPFVILPAMLTGHMAYVDIGWPTGLTVLGALGWVCGDGFWLRRSLMGLCVLAHGARMAFGALVIFFPYVWAEDLPRYQYAKVRFVEMEGMPARLWTLKMLHDLLQQAFANAVVLACPVVLCCFDGHDELAPLEWLGYALWALAWAWESLADGQKLLFVHQCRQMGKEAAAKAVLGHAPYDGAKYRLWTLCRHPNYFGEWLAWSGLALAAVPSALRHGGGGGGLLTTAGLLAMLAITSRFLYDCLNYWTGAEPAEYFSARKRPAYAQYQRTVRAFWPCELPFIDHGRVAGWPAAAK